MPTQASKTDTYIDHELTVAERYRWWGVYLIREKRRLQGIAAAVQAEEAAAALGQRIAAGPTLDLGVPGGVEAPEEILEEALEETPAHIDAGEEADGPAAEDDQGLRRRLRGRAALLGAQQRDEGEEDD
jgi:hypothetical protein